MTNTYDVGVIVGRFQVDRLHRGHLALFEEARKKAKRLIVFLGTTCVKGSMRNPLDFECRKNMIRTAFPEIDVYPIADERSDTSWSNTLDAKVSEVTPQKQTVVLLGSRDSFIRHYLGGNDVQELESCAITSGTQVRDEIARNPTDEPPFRAGVVYASQNRYPISYQCVDIVVWDVPENGDPRVLLGRKAGEENYRMLGGFVDPTDDSLEDAARRELREEAGMSLEVGDIKYVTSTRVDDWRYRSETDKLMTSLFVTDRLWGPVTPGDDICEVRWFKASDVTPGFVSAAIVPEHQDLVNKAMGAGRNLYLEGK